jgi:hypothetical protein
VLLMPAQPRRRAGRFALDFVLKSLRPILVLKFEHLKLILPNWTPQGLVPHGVKADLVWVRDATTHSTEG